MFVTETPPGTDGGVMVCVAATTGVAVMTGVDVTSGVDVTCSPAHPVRMIVVARLRAVISVFMFCYLLRIALACSSRM